jgi:hypothetical protein
MKNIGFLGLVFVQTELKDYVAILSFLVSTSVH